MHTFLFSKFLILCSITTIACRIGSTASVEACFSSFAVAAEGIFHGQQLGWNHGLSKIQMS